MTINALIVPSLDNYDSIDEWAEALVGSLTTLSEDALTEATTVFDTQGREIVGINGLHVYDGAGNPVVADDIVQINTAHLADAAITEPKIADASIGTAKIQNAAIVSALIGNLQVLTAHINDLAVNEAKIANLAVTSAKIALLAVGNAQINDLDVGKLTAGTIAAALIMTGKLTLGSATFGSSGIQLEYNSGNPRLYAGDGGEKYLKFEASTGEVAIGRDTELSGADAYNNDAHYIHLYMPDAIKKEYTTGSGSTYIDDFTQYVLKVTTASGDVAACSKSHELLVSSELTYNKVRRWKAKIYVAGDTGNRTWEIGMGANDAMGLGTDARRISFLSINGTVYGRCCNGSSCTTNNFGVISFSSVQLIEIVWINTTSAEFFIGGVSKGTVTGNLPSSALHAEYVVTARIENTAVATNEGRIHMSEFKFLQEA
jgi:hypothetical protein